VTTSDQLEVWWERNRKLVYGLCAAGLIVVGGKLGWDYMSHQRELGIEADYAKATSPEQLKAFAAAHPDHSLAGLAQIQIADEAFSAGKSADALAGYEKAIAILKTGPLATRAQLGRAVAQIQTGKAAEATTELKRIAADANLPITARAEANYHLANLAAAKGDSAEVQKLSDTLNQLDPTGIWTARAMALRASLPVPPAPAASTPATNASAPASPAASEKKDGASSSIQVKVPGK
jgi:hypothetical protein